MNSEAPLREHILRLWKQSGRDRMIKISGTSMRPLIAEGDSIVVRPVADASEIRIGDVAVFGAGAGLIAHRIVGRNRRGGDVCFMQKGDNTFYPQQISGDIILGKVVLISKKGMDLHLATRSWTIVNRMVGQYWSSLFAVLGTCRYAKRKLVGTRRLSALGGIYRKTADVLNRLPKLLFRWK